MAVAFVSHAGYLLGGLDGDPGSKRSSGSFYTKAGIRILNTNLIYPVLSDRDTLVYISVYKSINHPITMLWKCKNITKINTKEVYIFQNKLGHKINTNAV